MIETSRPWEKIAAHSMPTSFTYSPIFPPTPPHPSPSRPGTETNPTGSIADAVETTTAPAVTEHNHCQQKPPVDDEEMATTQPQTRAPRGVDANAGSSSSDRSIDSSVGSDPLPALLARKNVKDNSEHGRCMKVGQLVPTVVCRTVGGLIQDEVVRGCSPDIQLTHVVP